MLLDFKVSRILLIVGVKPHCCNIVHCLSVSRIYYSSLFIYDCDPFKNHSEIRYLFKEAIDNYQVNE